MTSLGDYLTKIGAAAMVGCDVSPFAVDCTREQQKKLLSRAKNNKWPTDVAETTHPFFCNRGRRSLARGVVQARLWLAEMSAGQRQKELESVETSEPIQLSLPSATPHESGWQTYAGRGGWWNLGTLIPAVIRSQETVPERLVSAWVPVLAWESQQWIDEHTARTWLKAGAPKDDPKSQNSVILPWWDKPLAAEIAKSYFCSILPYMNGQIKKTVRYILANRISDQAAEYYLELS